MLLAITVSFLGGQTFSKYVTEIKGSGKAEVAAWSFKAYGENEQTQTVNLASTVNDATLLNNKIAPGTKGSFVIRIDGRGSDVGINYNLKAVNETQRPQNLIYTCKGITYPDIEHLMAASGGTIDANDPEKVKEAVNKAKDDAVDILKTTKDKAVELSQSEQFKTTLTAGKDFLVGAGGMLADGLKAGADILMRNEQIKKVVDQADEKLDVLRESESLRNAVDTAEEVTGKVTEAVFGGIKKFFDKEANRSEPPAVKNDTEEEA